MSGKIKSFSAGTDYNGVKITLVRHERSNEMREEISDRFSDTGVHMIEQSELGLRSMRGLTLAHYDSKTNNPEIIVFIPCDMTLSQYREIIPHEALHCSMAIIRNKLTGEMYPHHEVTICNEPSLGTPEESVAMMVGEITQLLWHMIDIIKPEIVAAAFKSGLD